MDLPQGPLRDIAAYILKYIYMQYMYTYIYIIYIHSILNCQKEDIGRKTQSALCILHHFVCFFSGFQPLFHHQFR